LKNRVRNFTVEDWHSAFIVRELFLQTGCFDDLTKDEINKRLVIFANKEIPVDFLLKIRGKTVYIVSYVKGRTEDGKLRYGTWSLVDKDPDRLLEAFKVSISKDYPTKYNPDVLKESRTEEVASSPSNGKPYDIDEDFLI
jgi:hypothetical protein